MNKNKFEKAGKGLKIAQGLQAVNLVAELGNRGVVIGASENIGKTDR